MERYLVFGFQSHEASGGWYDFLGMYAALHEARMCGRQFVCDMLGGDISWHIVDTSTGMLVLYDHQDGETAQHSIGRRTDGAQVP